MGAKKKKILIIAGGGALIVIAAIIAVLSFDINSYKQRMETAASGATGLEVRINGKMGLTFFPFGISAHDIHVASKEGEILSLKKLKLGVALIPLLIKQLNVTSCDLVKPTISIVKDAEGKYNFERSDGKPGETRRGSAFQLTRLRLSEGTLVYLDKMTGDKTELKEINLVIKDVSIGDTEDIIKTVSFTGNMDCKAVRKMDFQIDNVSGLVKADKGVITLAPLTMDIFGAKGEGDARVDKTKVDAVYTIKLKVAKLDFAKLEGSFDSKKVLGGTGDLDASLTVREKGSRNLLSGMEGTISLRGADLVMYTMDLDKFLSSYETSQKFNLVDLGAFFIAGPLGTVALTASTVALKAYRYGDVYNQTRGGQSDITQFISHWKIRDGIAEATDCALATRHNRVALKGRLNLVSEHYDDVTVALLDDKGCVKFKQSLIGSFDSPRIGAVSAVGSIVSPIADLYRKTKRFVRGGKCEVFYSGAVRQP